MNAPIRLMDDDRFSESLRADLRAASATPPVEYDERAGLERFSALIALPAVGIAAAATAKAAAVSAGVVTTAGAGAALPAATSTLGVATVGAKVGVGLKLVLGFVAAASVVSGSVYVATRPAGAPPPAERAEATAVIASASIPRGPEEDSVRPIPPTPLETAAPVVHPSSKPTPSASADPKASVKAEMAHHAALRASLGDPARALQLADEGHAKFPRGVFGQEREIIAIQSLQRLGRTDEAKRRSDAFVAAHPESMYAKSLREQQ